MIHSIVPNEFIYGESHAMSGHIVDYVYQGMLMEVKPLSTGQALIVRLINAPLDHYLDERYAPGALIPYYG